MKTNLLYAFVACVASGCSTGSTGGPCPDCCQPGDTTRALTIGCRIERPDGGGVVGAVGRCGSSDGGGVSDGTGMLAFSVRQATCGIATGSLDCGLVALTLDGGPLKVIDPSFDAGSTSIHSARLNASKCVVIAPE